MHIDLRLVVNKVNGTFEAKEDRMKYYLGEVKKELTHFHKFEII